MDAWKCQVSRFQGAVLKWNKEVFGNIFTRKKFIMKELELLDNQIATNTSPSLEQARNRVWQDYEKVLYQEELLWFQKPRFKWHYFGDRNTRFFHEVTAIRRRKSSFDMLQDEEGVWLGNREQIENMINRYFQKLFVSEGRRDPMPVVGAFLKLSEENISTVNRKVSRSDIFNVIRSMNPFKAPGIDGLHVAFFQSQWNHVGDSFVP